MIGTVEAIVDENGRVRLLEDVKLPAARRALVTILEDRAGNEISETALSSGPSFAKDWDHPEEDEAGSHFQQAQ